MPPDKVTVSTARISVDTTKRISATKLRGYLGHLFVQDAEFHHHDSGPYRYPLVQYKRVRDALLVMGINDYARVISEKMPKLKEVVLPRYKVGVTSVEISTATHEVTDAATVYEFLSPWLALNSKNYDSYRELDSQLRYGFLENILVANLLSTLKGMGIRIDYRLYASIQTLKPVHAVAHQNPFYAFYARFVANLSLPDLIGIGHSVSKGFGVISRA